MLILQGTNIEMGDTPDLLWENSVFRFQFVVENGGKHTERVLRKSNKKLY